MSEKPKAYPKNVEGDFYVKDDCCTICGVPEYYAPDIVTVDLSDSHCFVSKQPTNQNELYQAVKVIWAAEFRCVRYGGTNPKILKRLAEAGVSDSCDNEHLVQNIEPLLRNHVIFECSEFESALEIAERFKAFILQDDSEYDRHKFTDIIEDESGISFSYGWTEKESHSVWFNRIESTNMWHVFHSIEDEKSGSKSVSLQIDKWLGKNENVSGIKWFTKSDRKKSSEWLETPL